MTQGLPLGELWFVGLRMNFMRLDLRAEKGEDKVESLIIVS